MRRRRRHCLALALACCAVIALSGCTNLFLQPDRRTYFADVAAAATANDVWLEATDGSRLHALHLPTAGAPRATVLFLHGNAENLSSHVRAIDWLPAQGYAVLALDYRGYGRSEGQATLAAAHDDAVVALAHLQAQGTAVTGPLVVFGQSLGAAVALHTAATVADRSGIAAVIADSGFASYRDIAREKLAAFWLTWPLQIPLGWTISDARSPVEVIARIAPIPLLILHGDADRVVPSHHADRLHAVARAPKTLWHLDGARHIEAVRQPAVQQRLVAFIASATESADRTPH